MIEGSLCTRHYKRKKEEERRRGEVEGRGRGGGGGTSLAIFKWATLLLEISPKEIIKMHSKMYA